MASSFVYLFLLQVGGDSPAFFLMPSRAWQFGFGALSALAVARRAGAPSPVVRWACLCNHDALLLRRNPAFYNELALASAAAVFLVASYGLSEAMLSLSKVPLRWMGLRSFSLYLWHWPNVAYLNYAFVEAVPLIAGIALCVALSEVSYQLVEMNFRHRYRLSHTIALIAASCLAITALALQRPSVVTEPDFSERLAR